MQDLVSLMDLMKGMGNTRPSRVIVPDETVHMRCQCNKRQPREQMPLLNSGVVTYRSNICRGCPAVDRKWATLVCVGCREVVAHMEPGQDPVDGFVFRPGATYHVMTCAACRPAQKDGEAVVVDIVERLLWRRHHPTPQKTTLNLAP